MNKRKPRRREPKAFGREPNFIKADAVWWYADRYGIDVCHATPFGPFTVRVPRRVVMKVADAMRRIPASLK